MEWKSEMPQERPNILQFITDQQRYDTIAGLGYRWMQTPTLDRLAEEGTSFEQWQQELEGRRGS